MAGRPPVPRNLKVLRGTLRKCRDKPNPVPEEGKVGCPRWMGAEARKFWKYYEPMMMRMKVLTPADQAAFAAFCNACATMKEANRILEEDGYMIYTAVTLPDGHVFLDKNKQPVLCKVPSKHPAVSVLMESWRHIKALGTEFGLTPSSRGRIKLPDAPKKSKFKEYLENG